MMSVRNQPSSSTETKTARRSDERSPVTGLVFDIKRFAIHDGPGIRTTVFLKGCPLTCLWCHNPESQSRDPEILYSPDQCIACGHCAAVCPHGCHTMVEGVHEYDRTLCKQCGLCTEECYSQALELAGRPMTVEQVLEEVLRDRPFYETSDGGMTVSGGEPMVQFSFAKALLTQAKDQGIHTCLDTTGVAPVARYRELTDLVDLYLYDLKETDPERHKMTVGAPLDIVLENMKEIDRLGSSMILRCPIIPGLNARPDHFEAIGKIADSLKQIVEINILPYHALGVSKTERLGKEPVLRDVAFPEDEVVEQWIEMVQRHTSVPVRQG